jgi:hypothetical protein
MRHGAGTFMMRRISTRSSSTPMAKSMVEAGMARTRMGGSCGQVPLWCVSLADVEMGQGRRTQSARS